MTDKITIALTPAEVAAVRRALDSYERHDLGEDDDSDEIAAHRSVVAALSANAHHEPPAPTMWAKVNDRVVTLRPQSDGTVTVEDIAAFQRECSEAIADSRRAIVGTLQIVPRR